MFVWVIRLVRSHTVLKVGGIVRNTMSSYEMQKGRRFGGDARRGDVGLDRCPAVQSRRLTRIASLTSSCRLSCQFGSLSFRLLFLPGR